MHLPEPILVFDIGGTKVAAAVLAPDFTISQRREIATLAMEGPERVAVRIVALGREVLAAYAAGSGVQARRVGIASAGQFDRQTGVVSYATFHLPGSAFRSANVCAVGWKCRSPSTTT